VGDSVVDEGGVDVGDVGDVGDDNDDKNRSAGVWIIVLLWTVEQIEMIEANLNKNEDVLKVWGSDGAFDLVFLGIILNSFSTSWKKGANGSRETTLNKPQLEIGGDIWRGEIVVVVLDEVVEEISFVIVWDVGDVGDVGDIGELIISLIKAGKEVCTFLFLAPFCCVEELLVNWLNSPTMFINWVLYFKITSIL